MQMDFERGLEVFGFSRLGVHQQIYIPVNGITLNDIPDLVPVTKGMQCLDFDYLIKKCFQEHYKIGDIIAGEDIPSDGHSQTPCKLQEIETQKTRERAGKSCNVNLVDLTLFRVENSVIAFGSCPICSLLSSYSGSMIHGCEGKLHKKTEHYLLCPSKLHKFCSTTGSLIGNSSDTLLNCSSDSDSCIDSLNTSPSKGQYDIKVETYPVEMGLNGTIRIGFNNLNPLYFTNSVDYI